MSRHRYTTGALSGDYLRAGAGLLLTGGPALIMETVTVVTIVLAVLAVLFGLFGLRVGLRQMTVIEANDQAIEARGIGGTRLAWDEIDAVRLDYYSTNRDRRGGWMQLKISGRAGGIRAESNIEDFASLAAAVAARAPASAGMSETTLGNFRSLSIPVDDRGRDTT